MQTRTKRVKAIDSELKEQLVGVQRVAKVVKGGRRFSFSAIVVIGDGNGVVGYGLGKANEVTNAIAKAIDDAKKNLIKVPVLNGTVPHDVELRYGASRVIIKPAAPGTGVLAGGAMRKVLESAGIKDVLGKTQGSTNPHNVVKATLYALSMMRDPIAVAGSRGLTLQQLFKG